MRELDNNVSQFKNFPDSIIADNYNFIFENFVKRVKSIIINIYAPFRQVSRNKSVLR